MQIVLEQQQNCDNFLSQKFISGAFLQSSLWQDFLRRQKKNYWQLLIKDQEKVLGSALIYETPLPLGLSYLACPKGPIYISQLSADEKKEASKLLLSKARDICIVTKKREELFFRLEPQEVTGVEELKKSKDIQPRDTWIIDLSKNEEELLAQMHPKTRYNIGLAKKKEVKIIFSDKPEDIGHFLRLIKTTATRNQISVHSDHYYGLLWQTLLDHGAGLLAMAKVGDEVVAANLLLKFGPSITYLHGGSNHEYRNYMSPQLLQWECICKAKELGFLIYDFWGIAPKDNSQPHWQGITRFKRGFGGQRVSSPGAHDFIYHPTWYQVYHVVRITMNKLRNFR